MVSLDNKAWDSFSQILLAHLLAHYILHGEEKAVDIVRSNVTCRDKQRKREANNLAACLLMPADLVCDRFKQVGEPLLLHYMVEVPRSFMQHRLLQLGLS